MWQSITYPAKLIFEWALNFKKCSFAKSREFTTQKTPWTIRLTNLIWNPEREEAL